MELIVQRIGDVAVVVPAESRLSGDNARRFKQSIAPVFASHRKVALDLSPLEFMDGPGLGSLLSCLKDVHAIGGNLKLFGMGKPVRALFELVHLHQLFETFHTKEEVMLAFQETAL